jgi:hypothetical protein
VECNFSGVSLVAYRGSELLQQGANSWLKEEAYGTF